METERSEGSDIKQYAAIIWRWLWLIILSMVLASGGAYIASQRTAPIYEAVTTLVVSEGQQVSGPDYNSILLSERLLTTYAEMLKASPVLAEAGAQLHLALSGDDISVAPVRDTQLIRLKARNADPAIAAAIANTLPRVFKEMDEKARSDRAASSSQNLQHEMEAVQAEIGKAQQNLDAARASPTPDGAEVARLEALVAQHRLTYSNLLSTYEGTRVAEVRAAEALSVVEPAAVPARPVLPRTFANALLAAMVGAALAVGAAFISEYLDDTIKQPQDVERAAHLPVFATVARFKPPHEAQPIVVAGSSPGIVESFRMLRTNLQFSTLGMGHSAVTLLVTSTQPMEGKTTTVANLGASLAQSGKRVLLVDTDLRLPALHRHFGLPNKEGLTSLLLERRAEARRLIQPTGVGGLQVLTAGPIPANPAELLDFPQTAALLDQLKWEVDYVLLDSPPVLRAADASILAQKVDGVILVAEAGRVRSELLKQAALTLQRVKGRVLGVVLNKASPSSASYYYAAGHHAARRRKARGLRQAAWSIAGRLHSRLRAGAGRRDAAARGQPPGAPTAEEEEVT